VQTNVNNAIYSELGARWYEAHDDPVALLRAESRLRNPWIAALIGEPKTVLDIGCGAGFLSNDLARLGHRVIGLDASPEALEVARQWDPTHSVDYRLGDACSLPFEDASIDVACAMDFLEHVEDPKQVIAEAARVLKPKGLFFFHTFNRNWISWLVIIKAVEWLVKNTPRDMHVLRLFLKPTELQAMCESSGMAVMELRGVRPKISSALFEMIVHGHVREDFAFVFSRSLLTGYSGVARKHGVVEISDR
jgi:2-polyprenyl-6-hydroxyphenyl methylase/3-demethylubiquinone-9 3-methyltransferase